MFPVWIYIFAVVKPIENSLEGSGKLHYLETNGILDALLFYAIGLVIYIGDAAPRQVGGRRHENAVHRAPAGLIATRLYIASDLHAAETAWRKFLNASS